MGTILTFRWMFQAKDNSRRNRKVPVVVLGKQSDVINMEMLVNGVI